ncbi:PH domain-containing protein [Sporosarcina sp. BP05]|uniref:PH domain-containing protein n=1 Tax=Sporosarcina sp. BP05 TaxID=2758726 RepID=UPI001646827E|nr:PH domain-containing protein [Sporosarcina sp. BP05]
MYFPSKKDIWLAFIIWGVILSIILVYIFGGEPIGWQIITYKSVLGYIMSLLIIGLLLWLWFGTGYKVEEGFIKIRYGPFRNTVKIEEVKKLSATKNPLAAPALSIDRIEILHGKYNMAIVSPKNKTDFIRILVTENPDIQVDKNLFNHQND